MKIKGTCLFQFHKGSIKTCERLHGGEGDEFQFHKGSIKTSGLKCGVGSIVTSFNSIKVRLRRNEVAVPIHEIHEFQFHKGSIKIPSR